MPRIRKRTTKRTTTHQRAKVAKKSTETKKKKRQAAKKDETWKSKKKPDLGIPNSYPFKDQVLAELAEERRKTEEEKAAKRAALKQNKPKDEPEEEDTPGVSSLSGASVLSRTPLTATAAEPIASTSAAVDVPDLIDTALSTLQDVLDRADVICEVVDARDILGGRSGHVEGLIKEAEGKVVLIINKIDLVPKETLQAWLAQLTIPAFLFKSSLSVPTPTASSSKAPAGPTFSIEPTTVLGRDQLFAAIKQWSAAKNGKSKAKAAEDPLVLAFMGLPSVGKTSVLNSLLPAGQRKHAVAPVIPTANQAKSPEPTTKAPVEVEVDVDGEKIRVIDTPGWEYAEDDDEEEEEEEKEDDEEVDLTKWDELETRLAGDLLRRNLGRVDKVKEVFPLVNYIVKRSNHQDLMLAYNIPFFQSGDVEAFLTGLARAQGRIRKHGAPDLEAASRVLLRDWSLNTFPYYTAPSSSSATSMDVDESVEKYDMSEVLEQLKGKKELKKENSKGIVRFKGGAVDARDIILDDDYTALAAPSDDEDDDEDDEEHDEEEDDDEDDEEEEPFTIGSDDGEEVELEDGPEPSSGSDVEEENDDEEEEESEEEEEPVPAPTAGRKRKGRESIPAVAPIKKQKRVSFAKGEVAGGKKGGKGILKKGGRK
ncbi:hypothetical protein CI109_102348 [Kwoniella shandongensis]|uniref:Uncharacterized protein n=1 Tax=Kwoniella shandongensis TaxID=1734106 RepID=A0A5M6C084_9TREE|nr:uncharacterized protein CI109_003333 [Kwoniella shandongensis]KAA5528433.1 hypothetical protein CI109_003333 [Kwoniella shandongensis]